MAVTAEVEGAVVGVRVAGAAAGEAVARPICKHENRAWPWNHS